MSHSNFSKLPRAERERIRAERRALKTARAALPLMRQHEQIAEDLPSTIERECARHTGANLAEIHEARALAQSRAGARATGPLVTEQDRKIAKLTGCNEAELQAAAELRYRRFGGGDAA